MTVDLKQLHTILSSSQIPRYHATLLGSVEDARPVLGLSPADCLLGLILAAVDVADYIEAPAEAVMEIFSELYNAKRKDVAAQFAKAAMLRAHGQS
jgi:hypothetical protein